MNILMLSWDYYPGKEGGAERQCRKLVHAMSALGHQCAVVASRNARGASCQKRDGSVAVYRPGSATPIFSLLICAADKFVHSFSWVRERHQFVVAFWLSVPFVWLARLSFLLGLWRMPKKVLGAYDVIHVHESGWLAGVGVWLGGRLGIPVVCKVRNTPALDIIGYDVPFRRTWEKLRRKAHYIALHNGLRHELLREGISDDAISVIPNGVVIPPPSKQERNRNEVLYVGNFSQGSSHKGFDVLIRAWGMVHEKKPLARLTMVGGGKYDHWLALAEIYQCAGSICFCGAVAEPELYYSRASLFVLPSRHEGMSNALLEAQSFGLPVVVSDIPANRAVVEHEVTGLIVPSGDADALAQAICGLLCDVELCTLLGANARERIKKRFSSDQVVERLLALYRKLVVDNLP